MPLGAGENIREYLITHKNKEKVPNGCGESMVASIGEKRNYVLSSVLNEERRPGEDAGECSGERIS